MAGLPTIGLIENATQNTPTVKSSYFAETSSPITSVALKYGASASVLFFWSNWCGPTLKDYGFRLLILRGSR